MGIVSGTLHLSYADLAGRLARAGDVIVDYLKSAPADRIAVHAANSIPFLELYLAVPAYGRVLVPLNTRWSERELLYALEDAGAKVLFTDRDPGTLAEVVETVVRVDDMDRRLSRYEELLIGARPKPPPTVRSFAVAGLFYTGGTTSAAKGVMLTHANLAANATAFRTIAPLTRRDTFLVMAPMFHAAGTIAVLACIAANAGQVIVQFDPARVLDAIADYQVTHTLAVPTMIAALVDEQRARPRDVSSLRMLMHGASPITPALVDAAADTFPNAELVHIYGTTETSPIITALHDTTSSRSVGNPVGCEVAIADDGEVLVRGPNVMAGYWRKPDLTRAVLTDDGWYRTGDLGQIKAGRLHLLDRKNDLIVTGGENVFPSEVEAVLCDHPAVAEACVFGVADDVWGEAVHAAVVARWPIPARDLIDHCRSQLAAYKVPRVVRFVDELPKSAAGKVLRRALRA